MKSSQQQELENLKFEVKNVFSPSFPQAANIELSVIKHTSDRDISMNVIQKDQKWHLGISNTRNIHCYIPMLELQRVFALRNTPRVLSAKQVRVLCDLLHELIHTLTVDHTIDQAYKQKVPHWNEYLEFYLYPDGIQRRGLEALTEWYAREIFAQMARDLGWMIPKDFHKSLCTAYQDSVKNINLIYGILPDKKKFFRRVKAVLCSSERPLCYRKLALFLSEQKIISKSYRNPRVVEMILSYPNRDFEIFLPFLID